MTPKGRFRCTMLLVNAVDADADADADYADADGVADACDGEDDAVDTA